MDKKNHDAMAISNTLFKFTEIQSVVEKASSAINRARVDIENARQSSHWEAIEDNLGKISDSVDKVGETGSDLTTFHSYGDMAPFNMEQSYMYGIWAQFYDYRARRKSGASRNIF